MVDNEACKISKYLSTVFSSGGEDITEWFGYYNYDPLSSDHSKLLMNRTDIEGSAVTKDDKVEVGYYDIKSKQWHPIGQSDSFNWQQGSMAQWLPNSNDKVIFNLSLGDRYISKLVNIQTNEEHLIDYPIYELLPNGKFALGLDYERLYWCRAYHYQPVQKKELDVQVLEGDGIFLIDLENNYRTLLIDIQKIISIDPDPDFSNAKHWLEHIMISPDGSRFVFLHRFSYGDVMSYGTRIFIADINGANLEIIKGWREYGWSHFGWCGNNAFAIYTYVAPKIGNTAPKPGLNNNPGLKNKVIKLIKNTAKALLPYGFLKKAVGKDSYYQFYERQNGNFCLQELFKGGTLVIDGHPSFTQDGRYMVTDTYPDKKGVQRLLVMNRITKQQLVLGEFKAPLSGTPASCDLHPKLSKDNKYVGVDTAHTGRHQMMLFKINWDLIQKEIG